MLPTRARGPAKRDKKRDMLLESFEFLRWGSHDVQEGTLSFGYWLRRRRKALDLTQEALGQRVACSGFSIRKIEADERRPSRQLAERLATSLAVPADERRAFLDAARAVRAVDRLAVDKLPRVAGAPAAAPIAAAIARVPAAASDNAPFVGRSQEFAMLAGLVEGLAAGAGHTVLIEGEPGIGKSRLMHEVAHFAAAQGVPTLATNCYEIERATPYQPVIDLVMRALDHLSDASLRTLAPVALAELAALVPEIGERVPGLPPLSNDFPEVRQARLPRAVDQLLEAARGGRALILMVDDIQWADDASAQVLQVLARRASRRAVLVVYAYRDEDVDSDERLAQQVESLRREAGARRLALARLEPAQTETLVAALAAANPGTAGLAERLHRETAGNPFFLISILQSLSEGQMQIESSAGTVTGLLPDALRAAVRARLAHVPKDLRPLLETAAVLGRRFDFDTLLEVTREPEEQLLDAVEALVRRRLLREEPEGGVYDFSHDKLREVVYHDIGGARRRLAHRSVAEALERRGEGHADLGGHERDAQLAEHFERAHVWAKALHYLVLAGERSCTLFAMRDALHWLDRAAALAELHPEALDERQRLALYERRGAARAQAGQTRGAVADIARVVEAARASGDRQRTRDALVQLGMAYRRADAYDDATACLAVALAESRAVNDERDAADTLYHLGTVAWSTGRNDQAIGHHQQAVEICERTGLTDLVAVQAYHGRGEAYFANAEPRPAIDCYSRSLTLARGIGDRSYECENLMMIGHACVGTKGLADYPRATTHFDAALDIARAADLQWHIGPTLLGLDHVRACTGEYGAAWLRMRETLGWLESLKQVRYQLIAHDFLAHLLLDLGLNEMALEHLGRGLALGRDTGIMFWRAALDTHVAIARSRLGQACDVAALRSTLEQTRSNAERYLTVRCLEGLAGIALATGDTGGCRAYADEMLALAVANGLREIEAGALRWRGEALLAEQACAPALVALSRAATLADTIGRVRLQMDCQAAMARLFAAQGQRSDAQRHADRARVMARAIESSLQASGLEASLVAGSEG
jgi:tetratricopeptide (TPR) repeat protein/transcriptional regulator with XRE-family HTH domain